MDEISNSEIRELKDKADIRSYADSDTELQRASGSEFSGPCPKCGGTDRFHVTASWFMCRQCHPKRGDVIEYLDWARGMGFFEALTELKGAPLHPVKPQYHQSARESSKKRLTLPQTHQAMLRAHNELTNSEEAISYLAGRGFSDDTWKAYKLGSTVEAYGVCAHRRVPSIMMPWYEDDTKIRAIRYRFLLPVPDPTNNEKPERMAFRGGSRPAGILYGRQVGIQTGEDRTLILCEGEINAMSIWQVTRGQDIDVLSFGSESTNISVDMMSLAHQYGRRIVWMDKPEIAQKKAEQIQAVAIWSGDYGDANDLLQNEQLAPYLHAVARVYA